MIKKDTRPTRRMLAPDERALRDDMAAAYRAANKYLNSANYSPSKVTKFMEHYLMTHKFNSQNPNENLIVYVALIAGLAPKFEKGKLVTYDCNDYWGDDVIITYSIYKEYWKGEYNKLFN